MALTVDHVPYACGDLETTTAELEALGLEPEYGGVHGNGITHMSLLGFADGSYLELISEEEEADHGFWPEHIRTDAGPAAWCVRVDDIVEDCTQALTAGWEVHGPLYGAREREDGTLVEWDRAEFGSHENRLLFPFSIEDRTPLSFRVTPTPSVSDGPLTGIEQVVLATDRPERAFSLLDDRYRLPEPRRQTVDGLGGIASIPGHPIALATPESENWLGARLDQFRDGPCACLFGTDDMAAAQEAYPLTGPEPWPDGTVAFFRSDHFGHRLGVVDRR